MGPNSVNVMRACARTQNRFALLNTLHVIRSIPSMVIRDSDCLVIRSHRIKVSNSIFFLNLICITYYYYSLLDCASVQCTKQRIKFKKKNILQSLDKLGCT